MSKSNRIKQLCFTAVCIALCLVLPFLTGNNRELGAALSLMHIPVFICGLSCGKYNGILVGVISPLLRSFIFGMPVLFPSAVTMAIELAVYGFISGLLMEILPKKSWALIPSLIIAMITGRIVWGLAMTVFISTGLVNQTLTFSSFIAREFTNQILGIALHIIIIPAIVIALRKAKLIK